jgi:hypothetical protein
LVLVRHFVHSSSASLFAPQTIRLVRGANHDNNLSNHAKSLTENLAVGWASCPSRIFRIGSKTDCQSVPLRMRLRGELIRLRRGLDAHDNKLPNCSCRTRTRTRTRESPRLGAKRERSVRVSVRVCGEHVRTAEVCCRARPISPRSRSITNSYWMNLTGFAGTRPRGVSRQYVLFS